MTQTKPIIQTSLWKGYPIIRIEACEAQAVVSLLGGQVISYLPKGQEDMFWVSQTLKQPPSPIRGGVPVCWPYFSRQGQSEDVPFHGVARNAFWQLTSQHHHSDGRVTLRLDAPQFKNYSLRLSMELEIGHVLKQRILTKNIGDEGFSLTQALHSYFKVSKVDGVKVSGVNRCRFVDKYEGGLTAHQQLGDWTLNDRHNPGHSDRVYQDVKGRFEIVDENYKRSIQILTEGSQSLVIWNPGEIGAAELDDIGMQWSSFLCVETVNAGEDVIKLAPGEEHSLAHTLSIQSL